MATRTQPARRVEPTRARARHASPALSDGNGRAARRPPPSQPDSDGRQAFRRQVESTFARAATLSQAVREVPLTVAGCSLMMRFAGEALLGVTTRAMAHLVDEHATTTVNRDLTVGLWDQRTTGVGAPPYPWSESRIQLRGDVQHGWPGVHLAFTVDTGMLHYLDSEARVAACWVRDPGQIKAWQRAAPLRGLFSGWAQSFGAVMVHAAVVGTEGNGVLLTAPSGGGKSTTALACVVHGWKTLGDDFVLVKLEKEGVIAHSLYSTAKLTEQARHAFPVFKEFFPQLASAPEDGEKHVIWLAEQDRNIVPPSLPIRAIVMPSVSRGGRASLTRASPASVLRSLIPSSVMLLQGTGPHSFATLSKLVQRLPTYRLELGTNMSDNVNALLRIAERHNTSQDSSQ